MLLSDIRNNDRFQGFYIKGNEIVKTLDKYFDCGTGNLVVRKLFDIALLLYVDRFSPATYPSKVEISQFEQFVVYAFVWAYSLRAQRVSLGWPSAQNFIIESGYLLNSMNIYKMITDSDTPTALMSALDEKLVPLTWDNLNRRLVKAKNDIISSCKPDNEGIFPHYLHFFMSYNFLPKQ